MNKNTFVKGLLTSAFAIFTVVFCLSASATGTYSATKHKDKYPVYPKVNYGTGAKAAQIKHGEYLVKLGDCIACHTSHKPGSKPFAGGFGIATPFGTIYTPNLTPDKTTGIANWTDAQFIRAFTKGIRPDGKYDYPAFPYIFFNKVTKKDILDIKAYLMALPPVKNKIPENTMVFPFNIRFLQLGWRIMFFHDGGAYKPNPKKSAQWNRGAYIVQGLGHCSMCHTLSHYFLFKKWVLAAPIKKYYLAGNFVEGYYAPNITGKGLKHASAAQLRDVFLKDKLLGGGQVQGPMAEANHDSLKYLTNSDIKAITMYLESVKSEAPPMPKVGTGLAAGKKIFNQYCEGCHLTGAGGAPKIGDVADWAPRIKLGMNALYKHAINGIGGMPPKGTCSSCTDKEIQDAVQYIVGKSGKGAAGAAKPLGKPVKQLTMADGKRVYGKYCSACHDGSYAGAPKLGDKVAWQPLIKKGMPILFANTINGIGDMPPRGSCASCNDAELIAAVKYMVHESKTTGNYQLW